MTEKEFIAEIAKLPKVPDEITIWAAQEMLRVLDDSVPTLPEQKEVDMV